MRGALRRPLATLWNVNNLLDSFNRYCSTKSKHKQTEVN
jgi:hypothetical protein